MTRQEWKLTVAGIKTWSETECFDWIAAWMSQDIHGGTKSVATPHYSHFNTNSSALCTCNAMYVDYLTFFTLILLLTQPPCECTLTGRGSRVYPNNWGSQLYPNGWCSQVYPNSRGSRVYPKGWGSWVYPNGWGSRVRPGWERRCAWALPLPLGLCPCRSDFALAARASPLWFALCAHGLGFALTIIKWIHWLQLNKFIYFALQISMNSYILRIHICMNLYI